MIIYALILMLGVVILQYLLFYCMHHHKYLEVETYDNPNDKELDPKWMIPPKDSMIYLINMKNNQDRLDRFQEAYANTDLAIIPFQRIEGVNGKALDLTKYLTKPVYDMLLMSEKRGYRTYHYELTRGAVGCYLSHLKALREFINSNKEFGLIFEDDARIIHNDTFSRLNDVVQTFPSDWDILLLGCVCFVCGKYYNYYDANRYILMHAYVIKRESAKRILSLLENQPIEEQYDSKLSEFANNGQIKIYCLRDKLAVQWDMGTNIQIPVRTEKGKNPFETFKYNLMEEYNQDFKDEDRLLQQALSDSRNTSA